MQLPVKDWDNRETGSIELADGVFGGEVRRDLLARVVNWQRAKKRGGNHKVKERSEVARVKSKIYRQKGTGRARHGAATANIFRGGGVVHGPGSATMPTSCRRRSGRRGCARRWRPRPRPGS